MRVNGKEYRIPDLSDFDTVLQLEEKGINLLELVTTTQDRIKTAPFATIRDVLACLMMSSKEEATQEIKDHIKNGGNLMDLMLEVVEDINGVATSGEKAGFSKAEKKTPQKRKPKATAKEAIKEAQN